MDLKKRLQEWLNLASGLLEMLVGALLLVALIAALAGLVLSITPMELVKDPELFPEVLSMAATLVIGLEFIKMLCNHTMGAVLEVMLLAIARQMIAEHTSPLENLFAVLSIAILYLVRKYLYIPSLDKIRNLKIFSHLMHQAAANAEEMEEKESEKEPFDLVKDSQNME